MTINPRKHYVITIRGDEEDTDLPTARQLEEQLREINRGMPFTLDVKEAEVRLR